MKFAYGLSDFLLSLTLTYLIKMQKSRQYSYKTVKKGKEGNLRSIRRVKKAHCINNRYSYFGKS